jgi:hypothetical protein
MTLFGCGSTMVMQSGCFDLVGCFFGVSSGDEWLWISFSMMVCNGV